MTPIDDMTIMNFWVPSKLAKLCPPPLFSINGRFHGSEEGEIEAWYGHSWSASRDYILLYVY